MPTPAHIRRIVTSRPGGRSTGRYTAFNLAEHVGDDPAAVRANRDRLAGAAGLPTGSLTWMDQVHGARVAVVDEPRPEPVAGTDGLVTATPGIGLAVLVADCVPVLLADADNGVIGAVHAGRAGSATGVVPAALTAMAGLGADPGRTDALLGPAICGACYEVPAQLRDEVEAVLPGSAATTRTGSPSLDLRAGLARQLTAAGIAKVVADPRCTAEDKGLFSYRRDGVTGRFAGLVWLAA